MRLRFTLDLLCGYMHVHVYTCAIYISCHVNQALNMWFVCGYSDSLSLHLFLQLFVYRSFGHESYALTVGTLYISCTPYTSEEHDFAHIQV